MTNKTIAPSGLSSVRTSQLKKIIQETFGELSDQEWQLIFQNIEWIEIRGGNLLFEQGMPSDGLYLVLSGRLQAELRTADGQVKKLGEIGRTETIGEMALLTGEPRMASIRTLRDSVLTKLPQHLFEEMLVSKPAVLHHIARNLIHRLQEANLGHQVQPQISALCILPLTQTFDLPYFAEILHLANIPKKNTLLLKYQHYLEDHPEAPSLPTELLVSSMTHWMNEREASVDLVLYQTEPDYELWTQCCLRHSDAVLLLADAGKFEQINPAAEALLQAERQRREHNVILALVHEKTAVAPKDTALWTQRLQPRRCLHLRQDNWNDMQRLTRFIQGRAIGLVLAGGGARGYVHVGVYKALQEKGIPIDIIGGASAGSIIGGILAMDTPIEHTLGLLKQMAEFNPTKGDTDYLPLVSLIRGKKLKKVLHFAYGSRNIEDLWREFFCVSSNMSKVELCVHRQHNLAKAVQASVAIPGVFPPVVYGNDIHVDGGVMSNLPVETMRELGAHRIIAIDFDTDRPYELNYDEIPSSNVLLRQKITGRKKYKVPSIVNILMKSIVLSSDSQARRLSESVDLFFRPDVKTIGFIQWEAYLEAVNIGYEYARKALESVDVQDWI